MDKLTTGVAYGTSAGNAGFWALQLLDKLRHSGLQSVCWVAWFLAC